MMIRWMIYLGLLIFAAYESVVFEDAAVTMFFVAALLLFVLLLLLLLIQRQMLKVSMKIPVPAAEKNKGVQLLFRLENRLPFLIGSIHAEIICLSHFTGKKEKYAVSFDNGRKQGTAVTTVCQISGDNCGKMHVFAGRIRIWDIFHLFCLTKKVNLTGEITILPQIYDTAAAISAGVRHFAGETEEDEPEAAGHDASQTYQIRPYRPGDRLQTVHWKLTARNDELYVREAGEPICLAIGIFIDFYAASKAEKQHMAALIEAALSVSNALLEQNCRHFIVWYDLEGRHLCKQRISKIEDIYEVTGYLMSAACYDENMDLKVMYKEAFPYGLYAADIILRLSGDILTADEPVGHFDEKDMETSMGKCMLRV